MGNLLSNVIQQLRSWKSTEEDTPIPAGDFINIYPQTIYDAIRKDFDESSTTLTDELKSIYTLIEDKQPKVAAGISGRLMTYTGQEGQIGDLEVSKSISSDVATLSHFKIPTEKAIGLFGETKVNYKEYQDHINNTESHVTQQEREKWNTIDDLPDIETHINNDNIHVTSDEKEIWNSKASQDDLEDHLADLNNPHNVTAHQTGTYTRNEIDDMFINIRSSFFNYKSIKYDERYNTATLVDYDADLWNPNYILPYGESLPEVPDVSQIYFALKPNTDYAVNETQDCQIYIKKPGNTWQLIGLQSMEIGDLVIRYPDTTMCVWISGKFKSIFADSGNSESGTSVPGGSTFFFRPVWSSDKELGFELTSDTTPPAPVNLQGPAGYTPIKGVDYFDGKPGIGVPTGGEAGSILMKTDDFDYETAWKSFDEIINEWINKGNQIPYGNISYEDIENAPILYNELGENIDGTVTQLYITKEFEATNNRLDDIERSMSQVEFSSDNVNHELEAHISDFENPHRITAAQIGAVSNDTYLDHINNFDNPHLVTKEQIDLGNVDNTSDINKPISTATQNELDLINERLSNITQDIGNNNFIANALWDASTCTLSLYYRDGSELTIRIPIVQTLETLTYDSDNKELVITMPDGTENRMDIQNLVSEYTGGKSENVDVEVKSDGVIITKIIPGSITERELSDSINLPGEPTVNTPVETDKSTRLATTEFVKNNVIDNLISFQTDRALSANMGRILNNRKADRDEIIQLIMDLNTYEVIDTLDSISPINPLSANMGRWLNENKADKYHANSSGSIYGRANVDLFGHARASNIDPLMDGIIFKGTDDGYYAMSDHRHPTDVSRAPLHFPDTARNQYRLTGEPRSTTPPNDDNSDWIATTEWVRQNGAGLIFGVCNTKESINEKRVVLSSTYTNDVYFTPQKGSSICVTFKYDNTGSIQLNVQNTGAINVLFGNKELSKGMIRADHSYIFIFDGNNWVIQNPSGVSKEELPDGITNDNFATTDWVRNNDKGPFLGWTTTLGSRSTKYAYLSSDVMQKYGLKFNLQRGTMVAINFENSDKSSDITKLNVDDSGEFPIIYARKNINKQSLHANHNHVFIFDGNNWILENPYIESLDPDPNLVEVEINNGLPFLASSLVNLESSLDNISIGDNIRYKIIIANTGDGPAEDVFISQQLIGLNITSVLRTNDDMLIMLNRETNKFPLGDIKVDEVVTLLVDCEVISLPAIGNITVIHANDIPDITIITGDMNTSPDLSKSTKTLSNDSIKEEYNIDDIVKYIISINNTGSGTANNVEIVENPRGLEIISFKSSEGIEITPENEKVYNIGNIDPISSEIYEVECRIIDPEYFKNFIMINGDNIESVKLPSNGFADLSTSYKELESSYDDNTSSDTDDEYNDVKININENGELLITSNNDNLSFSLVNDELIITSSDDNISFDIDDNGNLLVNDNSSNNNESNDNTHTDKILKYKIHLINTGDVDASHIQLLEKPHNLSIISMIDDSGNTVESVDGIDNEMDIYMTINENGELLITSNNDNLSFSLVNDELIITSRIIYHSH